MMIKSLDKDRNGKVCFDEFLTLMVTHQKSPEEQRRDLAKAFRMFDKNKDGHISATELMTIITGFGKGDDKFSTKEAMEMISEVDKDKDGRININEFILLMTTDTQTLVENNKKAMKAKKK